MAELTIIDVLDGALDGDLSAERVQRMSARDVEVLREVVLQFYDTWVPRPGPEDELRVHLGGWVASATKGTARDLLHVALLYAHQVVIYDPIAAYFEPRRGALRKFAPVVGEGLDLDASSVQQERSGGYEQHRGEHEAHLAFLSGAVPQLAELAPLVRAGIVLPIPHFKLTLQREEAIYTAVRYLLDDPGYQAIVDNPVDRPAITQDLGPNIHFLAKARTECDRLIQLYGDPAYYLARSVAMASVAYASYLPPSATEWAIYKQRLATVGPALRSEERLNLEVVPAVVASRLPYFQALPAKELLAARESEDNFEDWRAQLRIATRQIQASASEGDAFKEEAREVLTDHLREPAREAREAASRSSALRRSLRPHSIRIATGAAATAATGGAADVVGAGALTGMLGWLSDALVPKRAQGAKAVLASLRHESLEDLEEDWPKREPLLFTPKQRG